MEGSERVELKRLRSMIKRLKKCSICWAHIYDLEQELVR